MTLKVLRWPRPGAVTMVTAVLVGVLTSFMMAGSAAVADRAPGAGSPVVLNGGWAPANRCPVDDPTMLAADGWKAAALCLADESPTGSVTFGNLTVATKASDHQFGLSFHYDGTASVVVAPAGGVLVDEPVELPGGLKELLCPSSGRIAWHICGHYHHRGWEDGRAGLVTWTMESAGAPYNFNLFAGLFPGVPFISVPVKVHLQNRFLGDHCYIGSDAEPIVLEPMNLGLPVGSGSIFDTNGTPDPNGLMQDIQTSVTQGARSFAVPAVNGCGPGGFFDRAIDDRVGLPSPAGGANSVTFNETTNHLIAFTRAEEVTPNEGKEFSKFWHSAVIPPEEHAHHEHGRGEQHWSRDEIETYIRHRFRDRH